mgnify:FL=1
MSNSITTLTEIELFEIIQRQQSETIERQAREIVDLEARFKAIEEEEEVVKVYNYAPYYNDYGLDEWDIK